MDSTTTTVYFCIIVVTTPNHPPRSPCLRRVGRIDDLRGEAQLIDEVAVEGEDLSFEEALLARMRHIVRRQHSETQRNGPD